MNAANQKSDHEKFCSECGQLINTKAEICPKCGVRQMAAPSVNVGVNSTRNKTVAGLLALFLGGLGMHKFYLGQGVQGVLYLIFCWTFIPAILGFFEGIILLMTSEAAFSERYA
jgi:TM2 domain-containing membrane protein YozV